MASSCTPEDLFTAAAAARYVAGPDTPALTTEAVRKWALRRGITPVVISGKTFYHRADLDRWKADRERRSGA